MNYIDFRESVIQGMRESETALKQIVGKTIQKIVENDYETVFFFEDGSYLTAVVYEDPRRGDDWIHWVYYEDMSEYADAQI